MNGHRLILMVGLPRSGKSTRARQFGYPIVNPDAIRLALHGARYIELAEPFVWAVAKTMVRALFLAGHADVILDATNTTKGRRAEWISPDWSIAYCVLPASREVCLARALAEGNPYIVPIIARQAAAYEPLTPSEEAGRLHEP